MTIKRILLALPFVFAGWIALMAVIMRVSDAAPGGVVLLPSKALMADLPNDAAVLGFTRFSVTLANRPGLTEALYDRGAVLVLPAGLTGCLPLKVTARKEL